MIMANGYPFSTFYKVKNVIFVLRWLMLGFPLRSTNDAFTQFSFNPCLEYPRFMLFNLTPAACLSYALWIMSKSTKTRNPLHAMQQIMNAVGISNLDLAVMMVLPMLNKLSNTFFFFSFKKAVKGTNKISRYFSNIDGTLCGMMARSDSRSQGSTNKNRKTYESLCLICLASAFVTGLVTACYSFLLFEKYSESLTKWEMIMFVLANVALNYAYVYPSMAISAEFLTNFLLKEIKEAFDKFSEVIETKQSAILDGTHEIMSGRTIRGTKTNWMMLRYDL